jgi:hypothetical protein
LVTIKKGETSRIYDPFMDYEIHTDRMKCLFISAPFLYYEGNDVLYSPNKYRETEGIKENKRYHCKAYA